MITVDHDPGALRPGKGGQFFDPVERPPAAEHQLADEDEVVPTCFCRFEEAVGESLERLDRHPLDPLPPRFLPARELAPRAVELAIAGQHPDRPVSETAANRLTSSWWVFGAKTIARWIARAKLCSHLGLRGGPDLVHHPVPFAVGEPRRVVPRLHLPVETGIRPEMMAVRREVQPRRIGGEAAAEQAFEAQRSVLSDHSSGNRRLSSVARK